MPQVFNAEFDLRYTSAGPGRPGGTGRSLRVAINRAVVLLEGDAPDPGTELDVCFDLGPGTSVEIHGIVQACDGNRVHVLFPRYTVEVGRVLDAASTRGAGARSEP